MLRLDEFSDDVDDLQGFSFFFPGEPHNSFPYFCPVYLFGGLFQ
jgi:hypothetical protein